VLHGPPNFSKYSANRESLGTNALEEGGRCLEVTFAMKTLILDHDRKKTAFQLYRAFHRFGQAKFAYGDSI